MRRVLFGTGYPQAAPVVAAPATNPDDCLEILDLRDLSVEMQSYTRFITLYAHQTTAETSIVIYVQLGDETPYFAGRLEASNSPVHDEPSSITFPIRGDVRVVAASEVTSAALFGYYTLESETPTIEVSRPLQPSDPISPFNVLPTSVAAGDVIHAFEEGYVDTITIDYVLAPDGTNTFLFPNGVALEIPTVIPFTDGAQYNLMSGIPMLPDAADQTITIGERDATIFVVSGTFTRT